MSSLGSVDIRLLTAYLFSFLCVDNTAFASFDDKTIFDKLHWVGKGGDWDSLAPPRALRY